MPASQSAVACLTPQLCVVVGRDSRGMGDIIDVVNGTPGKPVEVKGSSALVAISCPADVGCMVLGRAAGTEAPLLVQLNDKGQPVTVQKGVIASTAPQVPRGVSLVSISCRSLSDCGLLGTGTDNPTRSFEYAQWDGLSMHVAPVRLPAGLSRPTVRSLSCYTLCVAVGWAMSSKGVQGLAYSISGYHVFSPAIVPGDNLRGVSCFSITTCFAAGTGKSGGVVVSIVRGSPGRVAVVRGADLEGVACGLASCLAGGSGQAGGAASATHGTLVGLSLSDRVTSTRVVPAARAFTSVASSPVETGFAAIGPAPGAGDQVTTQA